MKRAYLKTYIQREYEKLKGIDFKILNEEQLKEYLEFAKNKINEILTRNDVPTVDDLNNMTKSMTLEYEKTMKGKHPEIQYYVDFDKEFANYKKPVVSKIPPAEQQHRKEINKKAIEVMSNIIINMENDEKKGLLIYSGNITAGRHTRQVSKAIFGADYLKAISDKNFPDKKKKFMEYVINMKKDIQKFATKMSDEKFLEEYPKVAKYFNNMNEMQNGGLFSVAKELGIELNPADKSEIDEFINKYSTWGVSMATNIENRLACLSDPMYPTVREEDMLRFTAYSDKMASHINNNLIENASKKFLKTTYYENVGRDFTAFNSYSDVVFTYNNISIKTEVSNLPVIDDNSIYNIKDSLDFFFEVNKDEKYSIYNPLLGKDNQPNKYSIEDMAKDLNNGTELIFTSKDGDVFTLKADILSGELIKNDSPKIFNKGINIRSSELKMKDVKKQAEPFIKGVGKVNSIFFKNTTPAFGKMTEELKKLSKLNPEKDKDKYLEGLQNAAKYAKEYLKAKNVDGKDRTSNTEARLQFAKDVVKNFDNCKNIQEYREVAFDNYLKMKSTGRNLDDKELMNKLDEEFNDVKYEGKNVIKESENQVEKTQKLDNNIIKESANNDEIIGEFENIK